MVGYKDSDTESLEKLGYNLVLTDFDYYGPGDVRTVQEFLDHNKIDMKAEKCGWIDYCNDCTLPWTEHFCISSQHQLPRR